MTTDPRTNILYVKPLTDVYTPEYLDFIHQLGPVNLGRKKDPADDRDRVYAPGKKRKNPFKNMYKPEQLDPLRVNLVPRSGAVPDKVNRSTHMGPVLDQGATPQCVAFSGASMKIENERLDHRRTYNFEADELYARCKEIDSWPGEDGTSIRFAARILKNRGMYGDDPRSQSDDEAERLFPIDAYTRLRTIDDILDCLLRQGPVWFGISVDKGIFTPLSTSQGWVMPEPNDQVVGGHAMAACGYWLSQGWLLVKNSWGLNWAHGGYVWMPLSHFHAYPDWDAWSVTDRQDVF